MDLIDVVRQVAPFLERWVDHHREFSHTPGIQVAVRVGDELGASFAVGTSNVATGEPLTTSHVFHVASHSKTFTATAVMQLVETGRLRLDDPVGTWVPELDGSPAAGYTVRELLGHQSGIIRDGVEGDHWQLLADFPDRRRLVRLASGDAVLATNEHFKYSNIGYSLLGLVVEAAGGEPYDDYVIEHIVRPLGLVDTGPEVPVDRRGDLAGAHGIVLHPGDTRPVIADVPSNAESAATGFYSTAEELTRYLACHALGRDELLSDASKRLMQRQESRIARGRERFYGLGLIQQEVDGRMLVGHSGGWPGHITNSWLDPRTGLCVSVLTNCLGGPATELSTAIVRLVDMVVEAEQDGPAELPEGVDAASFTGSWCSMWGREEVVLLSTRLYSLGLGTLDPKTWATPLEVVDANTLRATPEASFDATGEPYVFSRDGKGRATSMRQGGLTAWPVDEWVRRQQGTHSPAAAPGHQRKHATGPDGGKHTRHAKPDKTARPGKAGKSSGKAGKDRKQGRKS